MTSIYSFKKGFLKTVVNAFIFGLPILVQLLPSQWLNLTVGGVIYLIVNFLKVKAQEAGMIS